MIIVKNTLIIFLKILLRTRELHFSNLPKIFAKKMVTFAQRPKTIKELRFSPKEPQNVPLHL